MQSSDRPQVSHWQSTILGLLTLVVLSVFLQIQWAPPNHEMQIDGTVFAYAGQRILEGDIPYRDFWDHKPPGVYYLNSLAFLFGPPDRWTIWLLTVAWTAMIAALSFAFLSRILTTGASIIVTGVLLATLLQPRFYESPNLTEFYAVLPAIASMFLTFLFLKRPDNRLAFALGLAFILGVLLKQTSFGTSLACIAVILVYQMRAQGIRGGLTSFGIICLPIVIGVVGVGSYWNSHGALSQLWQSTAEFNLLYAKGKWGVQSLYGAFREVATDPSLSPLLVAALAAATGFVGARRRAIWAWLGGHRGPASADPLDFLFIAVFLSVISELAMIAVGAGKYGHYFLTLPPALCVASCYWLVRKATSLSANEPREDARPWGTPFMAGCLAVWFAATVGLVRPSMGEIESVLRSLPTRTPSYSLINDYVMDATEVDDSVLVWGMGAGLNFDTKRRSPTPYVYNLPLFTEGFHNPELWDRFMAELYRSPPELIIAERGAGFAARLNASEMELQEACGCQGEILRRFSEFLQFADKRYYREVGIDDEFVILRLRDS